MKKFKIISVVVVTLTILFASLMLISSQSLKSVKVKKDVVKSPSLNADTVVDVNGKHVLFIGDSLGGHQYTCLSCEMEFISRRFHIPLNTNIKYHYDVTLRPDEPCHLSCIHNETFLKSYNF